MNNFFTAMAINVVMYHYVRNNEEYSFDTFCRRDDEFKAQVDFFLSSSSIVHPNDIEKVNYFLKNDDKSCFLLTFDDGYKDHLFCAKYLYEKNVSAYFFPPINALNGEILDVNAIHMLIGKRGLEIKTILKKIHEVCLSSNFLLKLKNQKIDIESYFNNFDEKSNYDDRNTLILKRILQRDLIGEKNRKLLIDILIKKFINKKSSDLSSELYLSIEDLKKMKKMGMCFGSHGKTHQWLNTLSYSEQKEEISDSFISLNEINLFNANETKTMCYPFGGYNLNTIKLMKNLKIDIGFTTEIGQAKSKVEKDFIFKLPRWDTNNCWDSKWRKPCHPYD